MSTEVVGAGRHIDTLTTTQGDTAMTTETLEKLHCPEWCELDADEHAPDPVSGDVVHYGPTFGVLYTSQAFDADGKPFEPALVVVPEYRAFNEPVDLLALARDAAAAAAWLETNL